MYCMACGQELPDEAVYCWKCGKPVPDKGIEEATDRTEAESSWSEAGVPDPSVSSVPYALSSPLPAASFSATMAPPKRSRLRLTLLIIIPVVVLVAAGLGAYFGLRGSGSDGQMEVILGVDPGAGPVTSAAMEQTVSIIRDRLDELGAKGSEVKRQGDSQISLRLEGVEYSEQTLEAIIKPGVLEFFDVGQFGDAYATPEEALASVGAVSKDALPEGHSLVFWPKTQKGYPISTTW